MIHSRLVAAVLGLAFIGMTVVHAQHGAAKLTTQDYIDIQQLYARYNIAIDTGDGEGWAATFTPDGVFNNTNKGHECPRAVHQGLAREARRRQPSSPEFEHGADADR